MKHFVLAIAVLLLAGCGPQYDVTLHPVAGTVTVDGKPLANGKVDFRPTPGSVAKRGVIGYTDDAGFYKLVYLQATGCPAGTFEVMVSGASESGEQIRLNKQSKELLSELEVGPDNIVFDFDLQTE